MRQPPEALPSPAALRSRARAFSRALRAPQWVEPIEGVNGLEDVLALWEEGDEHAEERRKLSLSIKTERFLRFLGGPQAPRDPFPPRDTFTLRAVPGYPPELVGCPIRRDLYLRACDMPCEYFPPPEADLCEDCGGGDGLYCECQK